MPTAATQATSITDKRWRSVLRGLWVLFYVFGLIVFALGSFHVLTASPNVEPDLARFLTNLNLPTTFTWFYFRIWEVITIVVVALLSLFIFLHRSDDWMALLVSLFSFYIVLITTPIIYRYSTLLGNVIGIIGTPLIFGVGFLFPTGRFVPSFTRWWMLPCCILFASIMIPLLSRYFARMTTTAEILMVYIVGVTTIAVGVAAQVYRYARVATPLQRQQTKWIVFALLVWLVIQTASFTLPLLIPPLRWAFTWPGIGHFSLTSFLWVSVMGPLTTVAVSFFPLALVISMLRYRLWDVDVLINRSVVGFFVGLVLLCFFVPSAFLIQSLLGAENTAVSYLVSAAIPALLFNPTRKRVRHFVDQRLYGFRFDLNELRSAQKKPEVKNTGALTGTFLGKYEVLDALGKGGMGEVYKGYAEEQTVALKTLSRHLAPEPDFMRRFQRESEVMEGLEHPQIVKFYGSGASDGQLYLVLEFIDGVDLKDYLREKGKLNLDEARKILSAVGAALDYLHGKGIVHRDIKPSNIMLRDSDPEQAVLMDFGIAKLDDGKTRLTGSGAIGTIDYMAPEQIIAAKEVDQRADIYALGLMAYEMLAGETPFKGGAAQVMFAHLQQPQPDVRESSPDVPTTTAQAIQRALAKDPAERFASAGEFAAAATQTAVVI